MTFGSYQLVEFKDVFAAEAVAVERLSVFCLCTYQPRIYRQVLVVGILVFEISQKLYILFIVRPVYIYSYTKVCGIEFTQNIVDVS